MSTTTTTPAGASKASASANPGAGIAERRRRHRAKITAQVHVRAANFPDSFEEECTSVDVSRDGLLFLGALPAYSKGQKIEVTFPYSKVPGALNQPEAAEVLRVKQQPDGKIAVAVRMLAARPQAHSENGAHPSERSEHSPMVLAVESDARCAETMRNALEHEGYSVMVVSTAHEALEVLRNNVPDAFIAEVECRDIPGQDLCAIIKRNQRLQHVPVILLTRAAQPTDYSASHQMGAVVCMAKPFQPERLAHVVRLVAPVPATDAGRSAL